MNFDRRMVLFEGDHSPRIEGLLEHHFYEEKKRDSISMDFRIGLLGGSMRRTERVDGRGC